MKKIIIISSLLLPPPPHLLPDVSLTSKAIFSCFSRGSKFRVDAKSSFYVYPLNGHRLIGN
jgi:hypothetical protein